MSAAKQKQPKNLRKEKLRKEMIGFTAYPEEIARWKEKANAEDRPLSHWLRRRILQTEGLNGDVEARAEA